MSRHVGVALERGVARVTYRDGSRDVTVEREWDAREPDRLVDLLSAEIGRAGGVALSIGLAFLEIAKPDLPAMSADDRRRVLTRDSDRYFAIQSAVAVSAASNGGYAYATTAVELHRIVHAFAEWAPVRAVVASPDAIAAAAGKSGLFAVDAGDGELGLVGITNGTVAETRRVFASPAINAPDSPANQGAVPIDKFVAARGALAFMESSVSSMLLDNTLEGELQSVRSRRSWLSIALVAVACVALVASVDARRDATLRATLHAADSVSALASPALAVRARLEQLDRERTLLVTKQTVATNPLGVIAAISSALPPDAFVQRIEWDGKEWKLEGSTGQAAEIVPRLDAAGVFSEVRVLTASTRFRDGDRMRESFSVAFQARGAANGDSSARR